MNQICCVILAAGLGKRMGGDRPKALSQTREKKALIDHALEALTALAPTRTVIVTGHKRELLEEYVRTSHSAKGHSIQFAFQEQQLGTGHAVRCALPALEGFKGTVIITYADHPLFTPATMRSFINYHEFKKATLSLISFTAPLPNHYGRLVREATHKGITKIVETKDCDPEQLLMREVNSGIYAVDSSFLKPAVEALENNNAQGEYYLTDIVAKASSEGQIVVAYPLSDAEEAGGVNSPLELHAVNGIFARRQLHMLMEHGVVFADPTTCVIDPEVTIASGAYVGPNVQLRGKTRIEANVKIEGTAFINDAIIKEGSTIKFCSRVDNATVGENVSVGPFAHLRPGTDLGPNVRIGNFVETKNAQLAAGAKANHLSYLGDCTVGSDSNIGAGTITCNYDGYNKFKTEIGSGVFIGSNSALVAPVTIADGALVGAGSTITRTIPKDSLGVARAKQDIKEGWAKRRREKLEKK